VGIPNPEYIKLKHACGDEMPYIKAVCDLIGDNQLSVATGSITTLTATNVTATALQVPTITVPAVAAEHGAGVIGTGAAPVTTRRAVNGEIITEFKVDLKGLASKNTANDVIGLAAGGVAYIGRYVTTAYGIVYKIEMACLQVPAGGDTDVNVVVNSSAELIYDVGGGTTYGIDGGVWTAGKVIQNLVQGLTAGHYFYLTTGAGSTAGTYTGGQFIIRFFGHPLLT